MSVDMGDKTKQPECCDTSQYTANKCPNMKEVNLTDMGGETYRCEVCGAHFYLDYDEMR